MSGPILPQGHLAGLRVLIAEDSWLTADLLSVQLEEEGAHIVGPAATCAEAVQLVETQGVDVALVDLDLQGTFADPLVETLTERDIPVVIMTGYGALPTNADASAAAVLGKPVERSRLVRALEKAAR
jgi:CheY-like chemotaxis protein